MKCRPVLCVLSVLPVLLAAAAPPHHRPHREPGQLRQNLQQLRHRKAELQKELHENKLQSKAVLDDIHEVDLRLQGLEAQLDQTNAKLDDSQDEQRRLASDLMQATKDLDATREKVRARLRQLYMAGQGSVVSVLIGATTAGELASREYLVERIADADRRLFDHYREARANTAADKAMQDQVVHKIQGLKREQQSQQNALNGTRVEKNEKLESLKRRRDQIEKMIAQFDQDERDIAAQIASFSRRTHNGETLHLGKFAGRFLHPVNARMTSGFGMRFHPILHRVRMHTGVDFGCPVGTPIHAAGDGVVIMAQLMRGYGNTIVLQHGGGMQTLYGHCSAINVSPGQRIHRGQVIGRTGNSGLSTGPHLHFEVRVNGRPVNPVRYL